MKPWVSRRTNVLPWLWSVAARLHWAFGPVPDGDLATATTARRLAMRISRTVDSDTCKAIVRYQWLDST